MKWTTEQQNAIDLPVSDLIVSAAAGSGKTAVMAERIIKRLTSSDGIDIDKILIVTYTSAAASEIKERIMKKIIEKLSDDEDNVRLTNQLIKLPYAHISTIHSFCLDLIKKYFYVLGIDPIIKIADESEVETLKNKACDILFTKYYEENDADFLRFITDYSEKNDSSVRSALITLYNFSRTMPSPFKWLDSLENAYTTLNPDGLEYLIDCIKSIVEVVMMEYKSAIDLCKDNEECILIKNFLQREFDMIEEIMSCVSYEDLYDGFANLSFSNWREAKGEESIRSVCKDKRDYAKKLITKEIIEKYLVYTSEEIKSDNDHVLSHIKTLVKLVKELSDIYDSIKKENNLLDFGDFEHLALKLLSNPDGTPSNIATAISDGFEEIYVDEFQDCNNIQNSIFKYISGEAKGKPNIFCVGDMKQSIYRFRDSNPLLFKKKCDDYQLYTNGECGKYNKILLNANFRSRKTVLNFVNSLFTNVMSTRCGELDYTEDEHLNYASNFNDVNPDTDFIDIDIIDSSNGFDYADVGSKNKLSSLEAEAFHVAKKIKDYIDNGYLLYDQKSGESREIKYSDIVILLRSTGALAPVFEKALSQTGIPVYSDKGSGYFDSEEIKFIISLLKIIDNPDDDISLVSVMRSPMFNFDENALLKIRLNLPESSFYKCIKFYVENKNDDISKKLLQFLQLLEKYYIKSRYMDTAEFLCYLISDMNLYTYFSTFPDSRVKKTNVRFLLRKAKEFEKNNFRGIYSFVKYIDSFKNRQDVNGAKILSENDNVVRIMSIHKSKGLEFPVVFVSGLGRKFNKKDTMQKFVMHSSFGVGVDCIYREKSASFKTLNKIAIKTKLSYELASEELRVLYVALTRATEKLILTACVDDARDKITKAEDTAYIHEGPLKPYYVYSSPDFITTVIMGIARSNGYKGLSSQKNEGVDDGCVYKLNYLNKDDISNSKSITLPHDWQLMFDGVSDKYPAIKNSLDFKYSHENIFSLPANMTVTELKKLSMENEDVYSPFEDVTLATPSEFGDFKRLSGASFGTLVHLVMENISFDTIHNQMSIQTELEGMLDKGLISEDEKASIDINKLLNFFDSPIGALMHKYSSTLKREFSFKYLAKVKDIFDLDTIDDENIVVQGTIDAYFEDENSNLVIVDYKTDKIVNGDIDIIAERYHSQLDYYAKALEYILQKKVCRKILYLFDADTFIDV